MRRSSVLYLCAAALLSACGSSYSTGPSGGGTVGHDSVTVGNASFSPKNVAPDDTGLVVWTWNSGGVQHNITFEDAIAGSGNKTSGTFSHVFTTPGTYRYRCTIHSAAFGTGMSGSVVVSPPTPAEEETE